MLWSLVALPAAAAIIAFVLPWNGVRRLLLVATAACHLGLTAAMFVVRPAPVLDGWIALDAASLLFLAVTSSVFLLASVYAVGYLASQLAGGLPDHAAGSPFANYPEAVFTGSLLLFLAAMSLVTISHHWGLLWVAVEATTLASAPLIYFHRTPRSLEATWKYLVICSVGIALALLGNFFLAAAAQSSQVVSVHLTMTELARHADQLDPQWLKAAYLLLLVGYGTKMGLAPMHTWLPDAHSEAPSVISALLSGTLLNCAFLGVLRAHALLVGAGLGDFSREMLVLFGLLSMTLAAVFIVRQSDFKRLLAYSSVEHMGILVLGAGIGGVAGFGSMFHTVNHSLTKAMLFLIAGNTLARVRTKSTSETRGLLRVIPATGTLWIVGVLAILGSPPFGTFLSEFAILRGMIDANRLAVAVIYLLALAAVFLGMLATVISMVYGKPRPDVLPGPPSAGQPGDSPRDAAVGSVAAGHVPAGPMRNGPSSEPLWSIGPPVIMALAMLVLGLYVPRELSELLHQAAHVVGIE